MDQIDTTGGKIMASAIGTYEFIGTGAVSLPGRRADYRLGRAQPSASDDSLTGDFVLAALNGSATYYIRESLGGVQFASAASEGEYRLSQLPSLIAGSPALEHGGGQNDLLFQNLTGGYQLFVGGAGDDTLYLNGNLAHYRVDAAYVSVARTIGDPTLGGQLLYGRELVALNGSGSLFIDPTVENIVWKDGTSVAYSGLNPTPDPYGYWRGGDLNNPTRGHVYGLDGATQPQLYVSAEPQAGGTGDVLLSGNVGDYALSRDAVSGNFVLTSKVSGISSVEIGYSTSTLAQYLQHSTGGGATVTVRFANGQYLSPLDLPAYLPGNGYLVTGTDGNDLLVPPPSGDQYVSGGGGVDILYLRYVNLPAADGHVAIAGYELVAKNGSGNIYIDTSVEFVQFRDLGSGPETFVDEFWHVRERFYGDIPDFGGFVNHPREAGDFYLVGTDKFDIGATQGGRHEYAYRPVDIAATADHPAIHGYDLVALNYSGHIYIDSSIELVVMLGYGTVVPTGELPLVGPHAVLDGLGTRDDDALILPWGGDQYLVGGGGADTAYLHGNTHDYLIRNVSLIADDLHPALTGYELVARNGSGNIYIDQSTESVHFQNGQVLAYPALTGSIDLFGA